MGGFLLQDYPMELAFTFVSDYLWPASDDATTTSTTPPPAKKIKTSHDTPDDGNSDGLPRHHSAPLPVENTLVSKPRGLLKALIDCKAAWLAFEKAVALESIPPQTGTPEQPDAANNAQLGSADAISPESSPARTGTPKQPAAVDNAQQGSADAVSPESSPPQNSQRTLPRFLFRGFTPHSGGGSDPRLNGKDGIVPHGFLDGAEPTTMYDVPELRYMICGHLTTSPYTRTVFSSWTQVLATAVSFASGGANARKGGGGAMIAILDTTLLEAHVRIYHTGALRTAGLTKWHFEDEFLAYGPVRGEALHCVDFAGDVRDALTPPFPQAQEPERLPSDVEICRARDVAARFFRAPGDERPDVVIAVTVIILLYRHYRAKGASRPVAWPLPWMKGSLCSLLKDELEAYCRPVRRMLDDGVRSYNAGLCNPHTPRKDSAGVEDMVDILQWLEFFAEWKSEGRAKRRWSQVST
ncbi:hypothetical protein GGR56DRAFT_687091 [Xylariaceae sp. FL0804]|nr:hypothetical protein GGR56DRAFT_687091 [Xylariaceae sp. FL0804]